MIEFLCSLTSSLLILIASKHHLMIHVTVMKLTLASFSGHSQILSHSHVVVLLSPRNILANQVEFLGLLQKPTQKSTNTWREMITIIRKMVCNNYWSHNVVGPYQFGVISPRNLTSFTRPFLTVCRPGTFKTIPVASYVWCTWMASQVWSSLH